MPRRTTVILDDDVYEKLVAESIRRYGTARAISKVLNEILREALTSSSKHELLQLLYEEKMISIDEEQFEKFRKELSQRFDQR